MTLPLTTLPPISSPILPFQQPPFFYPSFRASETIRAEQDNQKCRIQAMGYNARVVEKPTLSDAEYNRHRELCYTAVAEIARRQEKR
jgi:hypothetical protein